MLSLSSAKQPFYRMMMCSLPQASLPNALRKTPCRMVFSYQTRPTNQSLSCTNFLVLTGLHLLNTEQRGSRTTTKMGWADPNGLTGLGLFWASSGPFFSPRLILTFCTWPPSFVSFWGHHHCDQVDGSLCMNFQSFHLGPREFSVQAHWSLPPLEASWHVVGAPWLSCKTFFELVASFLI
jgi:hypothetical protein